MTNAKFLPLLALLVATAAVAQVDKLSPALGAHLTRSIRTGSFCSYVPRAS